MQGQGQGRAHHEGHEDTKKGERKVKVKGGFTTEDTEATEKDGM